MNRRLIAGVAFTLLYTSTVAAAHGQVYHHRSTAEGDVRSSMADQQRAWGASARDWAEGYDRYMSATERQLMLEYKAYQFRREVEQHQRDEEARKAERNRQVAAAKQAKLNDAAASLLRRHRLGLHEWPASLKKSEYCHSVSLIDRLLHDWSDYDASEKEFSRRALLTEVACLRRRVADNAAIPFHQRVNAVMTLNAVRRIAEMDEAITASRSEMAMSQSRIEMSEVQGVKSAVGIY
jgi:hypothetical protein